MHLVILDEAQNPRICLCPRNRLSEYHSCVILPAILALLSIAQSPPPPAAQSPEAFIQSLYVRERHPTRADGDAFAGQKGGEQIYSPSLLAIMRKSLHDTPKGDIPKLEGDPICDCQDSAGLTISGLHVTLATPDHADIQLIIHLSGEKPRPITFHLLHIPAGWRIDDIATKDTPSLRAYLTAP
jgi:Protein of unknown function (DUF3828)